MLKLTEFIGKGAAPLAVFAENGKTGRKSLKLKKPSKEGFFKWCSGTGSNRRHEDFQSSALPTELPEH